MLLSCRLGPALRNRIADVQTSQLLQVVPSAQASFLSCRREWADRATWTQRRRSSSKSETTYPDTRPKSYILSMFPYPSGTLHMGHLRVYTISDVLARYKRMRGFEVLHPMGWDAFGLPAENAAIERGVDPAVWTDKNIAVMKEQLAAIQANFNWSQELRTCDPSFYKHTQKLFLMLHKRGLAYQAETIVNYDPIDQTVLANEQVDAAGRSWRSGALVVKLKLKQWFFRITEFKEALLDDLDVLMENGHWPERVVAQQRHWLGKSTGAMVRFSISSDPKTYKSYGIDVPQHVDVYTKRPDTLFGVTYLALSGSHPLVEQIAAKVPEVRTFARDCPNLPPETKAGFRLPGLFARNPLATLSTADTPKDSNFRYLPIYVAPYVLDGYGTGAVMGVPAHDARDLAFWKEQEPTAPAPIVVKPETDEDDSRNLASINQPAADSLDQAYSGPGILTNLCGSYAGLTNADAAMQIVKDLSAHHGARFAETWRLRDWLVSRQRYWGTPIPIVHCNKCGAVPVPEEQLPVELPPIQSIDRQSLGNPLLHAHSWINTLCPQCKRPAKRETDTMDTFVDSSWYFARFPDVENDQELFSKASASAMLPVDTYVGGIEHAILHLLYARFIYKFLASEGLITVPEGTVAEPFRQLVSQGMVQGKTFKDGMTERYLRPQEVESADSQAPVNKLTGGPILVSMEKMSKSKHNGVDPIECVNSHGADATRAHILFAAPVSEALEWDESKIVGIKRWFGRILQLVKRLRASAALPALQSPDLTHAHDIFHTMNMRVFFDSLNDSDVDIFLLTHTTTASVTRTLESNAYALNTTISDLTKLTNALIAYHNTVQPDQSRRPSIPFMLTYHGLSVLLRMLAPVAPSFAELCWGELHSKLMETHVVVPKVSECPWPELVLDEATMSLLQSSRKSLGVTVQVNGKVKFTAQIPTPPPDLSEQAREAYFADKLVQTEDGHYWLTDKNPWEKRKRVIVVRDGSLVNVVF